MRQQKRIYDAERHAVLAAVFAKEGTAVNQDQVGAYRTKIIEAGDMLYLSCYPLLSNRELLRWQDAHLEALATARLTRKQAICWEKYNNKRRVLDFEILCHKNFVRNDLHVCLTYSQQLEDWYDRGEKHGAFYTEDDAIGHVRNYIKRVKRLLKRNGCDLDEFRWIRVTVCKRGNHESSVGQPDKIHHHMLMHGVPETLRNEVERLWLFGTCNADRLQPNDKGIAEMTGYISRQEGKGNGETQGRHGYTTSRNILRPEPKTSDVKISRRRVNQIAADVRENGVEIFAKLYPKYRLTELPVVRMSDFVAGAYIYARMQKRKAPNLAKSEKCG